MIATRSRDLVAITIALFACTPVAGIEVRRDETAVIAILTECVRGERQSAAWDPEVPGVVLSVGHDFTPVPVALSGVPGPGDVKGIRLWHPPESGLGINGRGTIRLAVRDEHGIEVEGAVTCSPEGDSQLFTGDPQVIHNPKTK